MDLYDRRWILVNTGVGCKFYYSKTTVSRHKLAVSDNIVLVYQLFRFHFSVSHCNVPIPYAYPNRYICLSK